MRSRFTGMIPPVVTPFTADGQIDYPSLDRVTDNLIGKGMHGLFVLGSSGEVAYLSDGQREALVRHVVAKVGGRVPVLAGAIDSTCERVIDQARRLEALGVDALVVTCPFYAMNDTSEIADHFRAVAQAVDVPLFAYDVPVRLNGIKLDHAMLIELGREGVIVGVKDSSGNDVAFRRLVAANEAAGHPLAVLTGHECVVDGMLLLGADGAVPGYANVDPARYSALWEAARRGAWAEARKIQDEICEGFEIVFEPVGRSSDASGIGAFKTAMVSLGLIDSNAMAFPVKALEGEVTRRIAERVTASRIS